MFEQASKNIDEAIFSTVRRELTWSHITPIYMDCPLKRDFYTEMAKLDAERAKALQTIRGLL